MQTKITTKNVLFPATFMVNNRNEIWSITNYSRSDNNEIKGQIVARDINTNNYQILTEKDGDYTVGPTVMIGNDNWLVFTEYQDGAKCIWLQKINQEGIMESIKITDFGKYDNPVLTIHQGQLWLVWESHADDYNLHYIKINPSDVNDISSIKKITMKEEKAYRPLLISDNNTLYLIYESFIRDRYHLVTRCLSDTDSDFSSPVSIGFTQKNDQYASACLYQGQILIAWENSSPLEKGYKWADKVIMPAFGHGWKVTTRIGLRQIKYENSDLIIKNLDQGNTQSPEILKNTEESAGCPKVFSINDKIFIAYLSLRNAPRGWSIKIKYFNGKDWLDIPQTELMQKQRITPAILSDDKHNIIFIMGHKPDCEEENWTQTSNSTWYQVLNDNFGLEEKIKFTQVEEVRLIKGNKANNNFYCHLQDSENNEVSSVENSNKNRFNIQYAGEELGVYWGDLHMHTNLSVCSLGSKYHCSEVEEKYRFCKDVADLDFAMITDHDNMSQHEWHRTRKAAEFNDIPDKFVAFAGYEWTCSQFQNQHNYGHYNVLYKDDGPLLNTSEYESITKLWQALDKGQALTIPHHPGCKIHPLDWDYFNPDFEPLVEIFQVRGSYEYDNCPLHPLNFGREVIENHSIQEGLQRGYRFGFTAGGEHEGVGVTAVYANSLTREDIFTALQKRHVYGTTGDCIFVDFRIEEQLMGSHIETDNRTPVINISIKGTDIIENVRLVRNNEDIKNWQFDSEEVNINWTDMSLAKVASQQQNQDYYYYLVVKQCNGQMAWASPVFLTLI